MVSSQLTKPTPTIREAKALNEKRLSNSDAKNADLISEADFKIRPQPT